MIMKMIAMRVIDLYGMKNINIKVHYPSDCVLMREMIMKMIAMRVITLYGMKKNSIKAHFLSDTLCLNFEQNKSFL